MISYKLERVLYLACWIIILVIFDLVFPTDGETPMVYNFFAILGSAVITLIMASIYKKFRDDKFTKKLHELENVNKYEEYLAVADQFYLKHPGCILAIIEQCAGYALAGKPADFYVKKEFLKRIAGIENNRLYLKIVQLQNILDFFETGGENFEDKFLGKNSDFKEKEAEIANQMLRDYRNRNYSQAEETARRLSGAPVSLYKSAACLLLYKLNGIKEKAQNEKTYLEEAIAFAPSEDIREAIRHSIRRGHEHE